MGVETLDYVWVGPWESFVRGIDLKGMIVSYGTSSNFVHSFCFDRNKRVFSRHKQEEIEYISKWMAHYLKTDNDTRFIFFDQAECGYYEQFKDHIDCYNNSDLIKALNSKIISRNWARTYGALLPYVAGPIGSFAFSEIKALNPGVQQFTVQKEYGTGGFSTFSISDESSFLELKDRLGNQCIVMIAPLIEEQRSFSQNLLIAENAVVLFQPAEQLMGQGKYGPYLYSGSNYSSFLALDESSRNRIASFSRRIARGMQAAGYRGFAGIDYMVYQGEIFFTEVNPRMQSSTDMLAESLHNNGLPNVIELNLLAFYDDMKIQQLSKRLESLTIKAKRNEIIWQKTGDERAYEEKSAYAADGSNNTYSVYEEGVFLTYDPAPIT